MITLLNLKIFFNSLSHTDTQYSSIFDRIKTINYSTPDTLASFDIKTGVLRADKYCIETSDLAFIVLRDYDLFYLLRTERFPASDAEVIKLASTIYLNASSREDIKSDYPERAYQDTEAANYLSMTFLDTINSESTYDEKFIAALLLKIYRKYITIPASKKSKVSLLKTYITTPQIRKLEDLMCAVYIATTILKKFRDRINEISKELDKNKDLETFDDEDLDDVASDDENENDSDQEETSEKDTSEDVEESNLSDEDSDEDDAEQEDDTENGGGSDEDEGTEQEDNTKSAEDDEGNEETEEDDCSDSGLSDEDYDENEQEDLTEQEKSELQQEKAELVNTLKDLINSTIGDSVVLPPANVSSVDEAGRKMSTQTKRIPTPEDYKILNEIDSDISPLIVNKTSISEVVRNFSHHLSLAKRDFDYKTLNIPSSINNRDMFSLSTGTKVDPFWRDKMTYEIPKYKIYFDVSMSMDKYLHLIDSIKLIFLDHLNSTVGFISAHIYDGSLKDTFFVTSGGTQLHLILDDIIEKNIINAIVVTDNEDSVSVSKYKEILPKDLNLININVSSFSRSYRYYVDGGLLPFSTKVIDYKQ